MGTYHKLIPIQGATINLSYYKGIQINHHPNYFSSRLRYTMNGRVK